MANNAAARLKRTFKYQGQSIEMVSHLKIGVKDSVVETLRSHSHWDCDARVIFIGHCGEQIDFNCDCARWPKLEGRYVG